MTEEKKPVFAFKDATRREQLRFLLRKLPAVGAHRNMVRSSMEATADDYRAVLDRLPDLKGDPMESEHFIRAQREHVRAIMWHLREMEQHERRVLTEVRYEFDLTS